MRFIDQVSFGVKQSKHYNATQMSQHNFNYGMHININKPSSMP